MQRCHLQQLSCCENYVTTWKILLLLFCILTSYVTHNDYLVLILKFYTVPVPLHDVKIILSKRALSIKNVSIFFTAKHDVISKLRHSYAKGFLYDEAQIVTNDLFLRKQII